MFAQNDALLFQFCKLLKKWANAEERQWMNWTATLVFTGVSFQLACLSFCACVYDNTAVMRYVCTPEIIVWCVHVFVWIRHKRWCATVVTKDNVLQMLCACTSWVCANIITCRIQEMRSSKRIVYLSLIVYQCLQSVIALCFLWTNLWWTSHNHLHFIHLST